MNNLTDDLQEIYEAMLLDDDRQSVLEKVMKQLEDIEKYEQMLRIMAYQIVQIARANNCNGCPIKGTGANKLGSSCRQRIIDHYKKQAELEV